jgi:lipid-binding SYLF domain-containing protein
MKRLLLSLAALSMLTPVAAFADTPVEQRAAIEKMENTTLTRLYKENPDAQREIADAYGYATFTTGELALMWVSGGYGHGVAHNNKTGEDTYMQMAKAGVGIGLGAKDVDTVFVFHNEKSFHDFITTGLDLSGSADASAKSGSKGGDVNAVENILPGVRIYQMTDTGLMAQAMVQGTKYWRDDALNNTHATTDHPQGMNQ